MKHSHKTLGSNLNQVLHKLSDIIECFDKETKNIRIEIDNIDRGLEKHDSYKLKPLKNALHIQEISINSIKEMIDYTANTVLPELSKYRCCEFCNEYCPEEYTTILPDEYDKKVICDGCFDNKFFICDKCKRTLPIENIEDSEPPHAVCRDCCKPIGFPEIVYIAPDFPNLDDMAFKSMGAADNYLCDICSNMSTDIRDFIEIKFYKEDEYGNMVYKSDSGGCYAIEELNYKGYGYMRELDE